MITLRLLIDEKEKKRGTITAISENYEEYINSIKKALEMDENTKIETIGFDGNDDIFATYKEEFKENLSELKKCKEIKVYISDDNNETKPEPENEEIKQKEDNNIIDKKDNVNENEIIENNPKVDNKNENDEDDIEDEEKIKKLFSGIIKEVDLEKELEQFVLPNINQSNIKEIIDNANKEKDSILKEFKNNEEETTKELNTLVESMNQSNEELFKNKAAKQIENQIDQSIQYLKNNLCEKGIKKDFEKILFDMNQAKDEIKSMISDLNNPETNTELNQEQKPKKNTEIPKQKVVEQKHKQAQVIKKLSFSKKNIQIEKDIKDAKKITIENIQITNKGNCDLKKGQFFIIKEQGDIELFNTEKFIPNIYKDIKINQTVNFNIDLTIDNPKGQTYKGSFIIKDDKENTISEAPIQIEILIKEEEVVIHKLKFCETQINKTIDSKEASDIAIDLKIKNIGNYTFKNKNEIYLHVVQKDDDINIIDLKGSLIETNLNGPLAYGEEQNIKVNLSINNPKNKTYNLILKAKENKEFLTDEVANIDIQVNVKDKSKKTYDDLTDEEKKKIDQMYENYNNEYSLSFCTDEMEVKQKIIDLNWNKLDIENWIESILQNNN